METQRKTDFPVFAVDSEDGPGIVAAPRRLRFDQALGSGGPAGAGPDSAPRRLQRREDCSAEKTAARYRTPSERMRYR